MQNYDQVKVLGQGGFGKAILGKRKKDGYMVCIKEVRLTALSQKDRDEAMKEIKVLAALNHPYIVKYIENFQERGSLYIVMEFADGGDLAQKIEKQGRKPFSEEEVMKNFIQIALAIKYCHDRKILHRDLKGQNVFLMKDGTVKLGDFGIARVLEHTFQVCKTQIGTPFYLSPEICQGKPYNSKTDIWSLGCILYELCTLKHAFEAANMNALLMNIIRGKYTPIPAQYSQDLRNLVDAMLTKEPEKRPNINQILTLPFIKSKLSNFLSETLLKYEMQHTVIHGRKAFAAATIIPHHEASANNQPSEAPKPSPEQLKKEDEIREKQRQMMAEAQKRRQEAEEAERKKKQELYEAERKKRQALEEAERLRKEKEEQARLQAIKDAEEAERRRKQQDFDDRNRIAQMNRERGKGGVDFNYNDGTYKNPLQLQREREKKEMEAKYNRDLEAANRPQNRQSPDNYQRQYANQNQYQNKRDPREEARQEAARMQAQRERQKREEEERAAAERQRIYMEQKKARDANKQRNRNDLFGAQDCFQYNDPDPEQPRRNQQNKQQLNDEELRRKIYEDQRREAAMNRNRGREEMKGNNMRDALYQGEEKRNPDRNNRPRSRNDDEAERRRIWEEQRRAAQANRNRAQDEMKGNNMRDALYQGEDNSPRDRNNNRRQQQDYDDAERRRIWEEQRRAAKANRDKMKYQEMGGGAAAEALRDGNADADRYERVERIAKHDISEEERRRAYEEQRRAAKANRDKMKYLEMGGGAAADALRDGDADADRYERVERIAKHDISEEDRRKAYEEQRRAARANREKMKNLEMGGGAAADALRDGDSVDDYDRPPDRIAKHDISEEDRRRAYEEQRRAARANREKMKNLEMGGGAAADALRDGDADDDRYERVDRIAKHDISEEDRRKAYEEQRRAARANREKMKNLEMGGGAAADALRDGDSEDDYDRAPDRIAKHEISEEDRRAAWKAQRDAARANREKMKNLEMGGGAAADALRDGDSQDDYDRPPDRIAKHDISEEDRRKAYEEQRRAARANREKMKNLEMGGGAAADAMRDGDSVDDYDRPPDRIAKHDISEEDRRRAYEEQRRAAKANREKMKNLEMGGGAAADAMRDGDSQDDYDRPPDRIAKHEISEEDRRAAWKAQRDAARANREKMKNLEMGGGAAADAMKDGDSADDYDKAPDRIAKHEISEEDRRAAWRAQRDAARANREKMKNLEMGGGAAADAMKDGDSENDYDKAPERIAKHDISEEDRRKAYEEQRRAAKANREKMKNLEMGGGAAADAMKDGDSQDDSYEKAPERIAKHEISEEDRRAAWKAQRDAARANREKMKNLEMGGDAAADAMKDGESEETDRSSSPERIAKHEISEEDRRAAWKAQRDAARANREKLRNLELGLNGEDDSATQSQDDNSAREQKQNEKHQPTAEELAEISRQQRREARANRERLKQQAAGVNMDQLVQEAFGDNPFGVHGGGKAPRDAPPEQQPEQSQENQEEQSSEDVKKEKHQPTAEELAEISRQQRREARANREKLKQQQNVNMDDLLKEAMAEQQQLQQNKPKEEEKQKPELVEEEIDEPPPQKEKVHEITAEERRQAYKEQREIRKKAEQAAADQLSELQAIEAAFNGPPKAKRPPPKFLQRLQKKDGNEPSSARSASEERPSSARSASNEPRSARSAREEKRPSSRQKPPQPILIEEPIKIEEPVKIEEPIKIEEPPVNENAIGIKPDFGQALSSKSAKDFLKSRTLVMEQLNEENEKSEAENVVADNEEIGNEATDEEKQSNIEDCAKFIEEALCMDDKEAKAEEAFDDDQKRDNTSFHLVDKSLNLPVGHDTDSIAYRAEAIRAFLEKEIGFDKLIDIKQAMSRPESEASIDLLLNGLQPGLIILVQQLLVLDDDSVANRL